MFKLKISKKPAKYLNCIIQASNENRKRYYFHQVSMKIDIGYIYGVMEIKNPKNYGTNLYTEDEIYDRINNGNWILEERKYKIEENDKW